MVHELSGAEFEDLKDSFRKMDTNGDGKITTDELIASSMCTKNDVESIKALYDLNKDGTIDFLEYLSAMTEIKYEKGDSRLGIMQLYQILDKNKDGSISKEEIKLAFLLPSPVDKIAENLMRELFNDFDKDKDGKITQIEFTQLTLASKIFEGLSQ